MSDEPSNIAFCCNVFGNIRPMFMD